MRITLVRPCPGMPEGLDEALDRTGEGFCARCGETVVDLTRGVVPVGRVIRCARVLVVATAVAGCGGSPARPVEQVVVPAAVAEEKDGGMPVETPVSGGAESVVVEDDRFRPPVVILGRIDIQQNDAGTAKDSGR